MFENEARMEGVQGRFPHDDLHLHDACAHVGVSTKTWYFSARQFWIALPAVSFLVCSVNVQEEKAVDVHWMHKLMRRRTRVFVGPTEPHFRSPQLANILCTVPRLTNTHWRTGSWTSQFTRSSLQELKVTRYSCFAESEGVEPAALRTGSDAAENLWQEILQVRGQILFPQEYCDRKSDLIQLVSFLNYEALLVLLGWCVWFTSLRAFGGRLRSCIQCCKAFIPCVCLKMHH